MMETEGTMEGFLASSGGKPSWEGGCVRRGDSLETGSAQPDPFEGKYFFP